MPESANLMEAVGQAKLDMTRTVEVRPGTTITVRPLSKEEWRRMRKRVRKVKGSEAVREDAAEAAITDLLASAVVGWDNMTSKVVGQLIPVDTSKLPEQIPYTKQNVFALLWHSSEFYNLVNNETEDLAAFAEEDEESARGN